MNSLLHPAARGDAPDLSAFVYSILRLPSIMHHVQLVVLGQSPEVFAQRGIGEVEKWQQVFAPDRRRRCYFDGERVLACFIASRTDIDDVVPLLTAYQIEWNKFHALFQILPESISLSNIETDETTFARVAECLSITKTDLRQLQQLLGKDFTHIICEMAARPCRLHLQLLSGSLSDYWRATRIWWDNIQSECPELQEKPVYFISSNTHSVVNLLSGFALEHQDDLLKFINEAGDGDLVAEWNKIKDDRVPSNRENFFYYVFKDYLDHHQASQLESLLERHEKSLGIQRIPSLHSFDVEAQVIRLSQLDPGEIDPRLGQDLEFLAHSDALILNIDYPLGMAAYNILSKVSTQVGEILGVYITGKAATLNGVIGDVMIPTVVQDEHSHNTYIFQNSFQASDVIPYVVYGAILDNQKAVTVRGTFLQNDKYMDVFYREGYTDIEMEAGPYLSAMYEMYRPVRHPVDEVLNLYGIPFDVGILHYASDTPLSKGRNLGAGSLSYFGMDSTYGVTVAILRRIFDLEKRRLQNLPDGNV
ncbi:MAG: hypothetical protein JSV42_11140 [Chloroflexota bacterium]|nr:MAG: hypothetical protein JSV42_11140 [Chloroflexota bacterium]